MLAKLAWRRAFLRKPVRWLTAEGFFEQIDSPPLRDLLRDDVNGMGWRERLRLVSPFGRSRPDVRYFLERRLRSDDDGQPYFDLGELRLRFLPDRPVKDQDAALRGALLILIEAYVQTPGFFSTHVHVRPGDVVLDLGGNLGTSALLFSRLVGPEGHVYSFEPAFADVERRNLADNGARNVEVIPAAVGDRCSEVELTVTDEGIDSRLARPSHRGGRLRVPMTTLDEFVAQRRLQRVDFIKMDIEGAEELALRGAEQVIARFRPQLTIASYHTDLAGEKQHPKLVRLLRERDYQVEERGHRHIFAWSR